MLNRGHGDKVLSGYLNQIERLMSGQRTEKKRFCEYFVNIGTTYASSLDVTSVFDIDFVPEGQGGVFSELVYLVGHCPSHG